MLGRHLKSVAFLNLKHQITHNLTFKSLICSKTIILGIETSCDDTGCAVVDEGGNILGEALSSQHQVHLNNGGIIPPIAQDLHRQNIENVVNNALEVANLKCSNVDGIAVTVKPGLPLSLSVGTKYAKYLCRKYNKPIIPIHHMQAHALMARMTEEVEFPFLVLLISGGHCLLGVVRDVDTFLLLGDSMDDAPGEAFDKAARRMKLRNLPEYSHQTGGQSVELAASKTDNPLQYKFGIPLVQRFDCSFSMAGIKAQLERHIIKEEKQFNISADGVIPGVHNLCASYLLVITRHLCHRVERAMMFVEQNQFIPPDKQTLVVSGGVACNDFIMKGLKIVCDELCYRLVRPPRKLCTDNGIMIAWNGMERWKANIGITYDYDSIRIEKSVPLGIDMREAVATKNIRCKWVKLTKLNKAEAFK